MTYSVRQHSKIEEIVACIYILLLPYRMIEQFSFLSSTLRGAAIYFDVVIHFTGMFLLILRRRGRIIFENDDESKMTNSALLLVLYLDVSSLVMATVIQLTKGNYAGETAFSGVAGMLIYFVQYALILYYNREIFIILQRETILKLIEILIACLAVLGYWQLLTMVFGGRIYELYKEADVFHNLADCVKIEKLSLTGIEGASAGTIISVLVMPYFYSRIITSKKQMRYIVSVVLWLPILYYTHSTTAYILFAVISTVFVYFLIREGKNTLYLGMGAFLIIISLFMLFPELGVKLIGKGNPNSIVYLLRKKAFDRGNGSTVTRTVPFVTNFKTFLAYPILGVGNGLQGYFYQTYFPEWAYDAVGSDVMLFYNEASTTIVNGGLFFPSLLSGYGIVGCTAILLWAVKYVQMARRKKESLGLFYYMFFMGLVGIMVTGLQGEVTGKYFLWFVFSLPLMAGTSKGEGEDKVNERGDEKEEGVADHCHNTDNEPSGNI